jgi:hypothetical protein
MRDKDSIDEPETTKGGDGHPVADAKVAEKQALKEKDEVVTPPTPPPTSPGNGNW